MWISSGEIGVQQSMDVHARFGIGLDMDKVHNIYNAWANVACSLKCFEWSVRIEKLEEESGEERERERTKREDKLMSCQQGFLTNSG